jgi:hypothetical protein
MALSPAQIDALPTYTAAQQLKMWQRASIEVSTAGVSYAVNGRSLNRSHAAEILSMLQYWESAAYLEANPNSSTYALTRFVDPISGV